jgi:hypothetical protein
LSDIGSLAAANDGARWVLVIVFALASLEKALTLRARAEAWHPVVLTLGRVRRYATALFASSLAADLITIALLTLQPRGGAVAAVLLISIYTVAAFGMHNGSQAKECRCFWKILNSSSRLSLVTRNALLLTLGLMVALEDAGSSLENLAWTPVFLGLVLIAARAVEVPMPRIVHHPLRSLSRTAEGGRADDAFLPASSQEGGGEYG